MKHPGTPPGKISPAPQPEPSSTLGIPPEPGTGLEGFGRNTVINVGGLLVPIVISLVTVPLYLHRIGEDRYGVLAVVWVVLGYFAVFEFGLGRATSNQVARLRHDPARREKVFWSALAINLGFGLLGAVVLFGVGHALLGSLLKAPGGLRSEAVAALPWLCAAVPLTTATAVLAGALEGRERFLTLNLVIACGVALYQLAPLVYAYRVGPNLTGLIMISTLALFASTGISFVAVAVMLPLTRFPRIDLRDTRHLLRYGGWVAVGGVTSSFFTVADRVAIGITLGARSVARYTIPSTLVTRSLILALGFARTIFPRLSALDPAAARLVSGDAVRALIALMTPLVVLGSVLLEPFLRLWAGAGIAHYGAPVGEILLLGVWMNALAVVPYALLQAKGRPDLTAKISVLELAPYLGALWLGLHFYGLNGAAWAWTARAGVDAWLLFWMADRGQSHALASSQRRALAVGGIFAIVACVCALTLFAYPTIRASLGFVLVVAVIVWSWRLAPPRIRRLAPWPRA